MNRHTADRDIEIEHRFSTSPYPGHPIILRILIQTIFFIHFISKNVL